MTEQYGSSGQRSVRWALKTKDSEKGGRGDGGRGEGGRGEGGGGVKVREGAELSICYCVSSAIVT